MKVRADLKTQSGEPADTRRYSASRADSVKLATGQSGVDHWAPLGKEDTSEETANSIKLRDLLKVATWNVRGLLQTGKLSIVENELVRSRVRIAGLSETHWKGNGHFKTKDGNMVFFSGSEEYSHNGVGIWISKQHSKCVLGYQTISDRIIYIKLKATPMNIHIFQVYAPTAEAEDAKIDEFYNSLEDTISKIPNREILLILGDWNAKIGETTKDQHLKHVVGNYGMGTRNERGERLIQFCIDHDMKISNTMFTQPIRRLYTWSSPGDLWRNQIDYILIRRRWSSSIVDTRTRPGADCGSDHQLLVSTIHLKLKNCFKQHAGKLPKISNNEALVHNLSMKMANLPTALNSNNSSDSLWKELRSKMVDAIKTSQGNTPKTRSADWISKETLQLVLERRKVKETGMREASAQQNYRELNRLVQRGCRADKDRYYTDLCKELQCYAERGECRELFRAIKRITKKFKPASWSIRDTEGNMVNDIDKTLEVWKDYCAKLYDDPLRTPLRIKIEGFDMEPDILPQEIDAAISKLATNKAAGFDDITSEVFKALDENGRKQLHLICKRIWETGEWPEDWTTSVVVPLHKKGSTSECDNYRLIALISHASKTMLYVLQARLNAYLSWQISPEQAGFVKGRGTREQILNIRQLIEKSREYYTPLYLCFVDYSKAFDNVNWSKLWPILRTMGVPLHLVEIIRNLYSKSNAVIRVNGATSTGCQIKKGVRQGCILSPLLFNIYTEHIMRLVLENWEGGAVIGGVRISNLRFADDTTLVAKDADELLDLINRLEHVSDDFGLSINHTKTKVMIVDRENQNQPEVRRIGGYEVVGEIIYLGSQINNMGSCEPEIRRRVQLGKVALQHLSKIWADRNIHRETKIHLVNTLVFPIFLYAAETWTIREYDRRKIDAFEMYCWRRMLRIPWTAHKTNISVLNEVNPKHRLSSIVYQRILQFFGHISRRTDNLEKTIVQGKPIGKRRRGRSPQRWWDITEKILDMPLETAIRTAQDREQWRNQIKGIP